MVAVALPWRSPVVIGGVEGVLYLATTVGALLVVGGVARFTRPSAVRSSLVLYFAATAAWSFCDLVAVSTGRHAPGSVLTGVIVSAAVAVAAVHCLSRSVTDAAWRPRRRTLLLLAIHPVVVLAAGLTNPWHHLVLSEIPGGLAFGPLFWLHSAFSYVFLALSFAWVVRRRASTPMLQTVSVSFFLLSGVAPLIGNLVTLFVTGPEGPDTTPTLFLAGAVVSVLALNSGLVRLVPIARSQVFETLVDAVVVLDLDDRVIDANPAALRLMGITNLSPGSAVGRVLSTIAADIAEVVGAGAGEHPLESGGRQLVLEAREVALVDRLGKAVGRLVVLRDVTEASRSRSRLAEAHEQLALQDAVRERLSAELAELVLRDPGTGLRNRRYLATRLPELVDRARVDELAVVMLDIDHFKEVNDTFGHVAGDRVLEAAAAALDSRARSVGGEVIRYGGEEFVVLLTGPRAHAALQVAELLRLACAQIEVLAGEARIAITVSAGVSRWSAALGGPDGLIDAADAALYEAKRTGRARSVEAPVPISNRHGRRPTDC